MVRQDMCQCILVVKTRYQELYIMGIRKVVKDIKDT